MALRLTSRHEEDFSESLYKEPKKEIIEVLEYEATAPDTSAEHLCYAFDKLIEYYGAIDIPESVVTACCYAGNSFFFEVLIEYCKRNNIGYRTVNWYVIILEILKAEAFDIFNVIYKYFIDVAPSFLEDVVKRYIRLFGAVVKNVDSFCKFFLTYDLDFCIEDFEDNIYLYRFVESILEKSNDKNLAFRVLDSIDGFVLGYDFYRHHLEDISYLTPGEILKIFSYSVHDLCEADAMALCDYYLNVHRNDLLAVLVVYCNGGTSVPHEFVQCIEKLYNTVYSADDKEKHRYCIDIIKSVDKKGIIANMLLEESILIGDNDTLDAVFSAFGEDIASYPSVDLSDMLYFNRFNNLSDSISYLIHTGIWDKEYWVEVFKFLSMNGDMKNPATIIKELHLTEEEKRYLEDYILENVVNESNRDYLLDMLSIF